MNEPSIHSTEFEVVKDGLIASIPINMPNTEVFLLMDDPIFREGYEHLRFKIRKLSIERTIESVEYPADWWHAFKDRWFPRFLKRWFPVKKIRHEVRETYPEYALPYRDYGPQLIGTRLRDSWDPHPPKGLRDPWDDDG